MFKDIQTRRTIITSIDPATMSSSNLTIGPLRKIATAASSSLLNEDTCCIAWPDKQSHNSVIHVNLGSLASVSEKELAEKMAWRLANGKQPFLYVIRSGSICGSDWIDLMPQGFAEAIGERGVRLNMFM